MKLGIAFLFVLSTSIFCVEGFKGIPNVKVYSDPSSTKKNILDNQEQLKNVILIEYKNDGYLWVSRSNTELFTYKSGIFIQYIAKNGSGYVKVNTETGEFLEHVHLHLQTITYWGTGSFIK